MDIGGNSQNEKKLLFWVPDSSVQVNITYNKLIGSLNGKEIDCLY